MLRWTFSGKILIGSIWLATLISCAYTEQIPITELDFTKKDYSIFKTEPILYDKIDDLPKNEEIEYEIIFINSSYFYDPTTYLLKKYWWIDELSFDIPQVIGMEDVELERKINKSIAHALLYWIGGPVGYLTIEERQDISSILLPYFDDSHPDILLYMI
ncbi:MAG: hypothetical protein FWE02_00810 [Defluviitaleaceae bacterium]|nr:hypothetical protein [Defluviitaleaceae bacterium]